MFLFFLVLSHGPRCDAVSRIVFTVHVNRAVGAVDPATNLHLLLSLNCERNNVLIVMNRKFWLWVVTPCSSDRVRYFAGTYRLCLDGRKVNQARNQVCLLLLVSCVVNSFHPEDGGDMFLRNICLSPNCTALQPSRRYSSLLVVTVVGFCKICQFQICTGKREEVLLKKYGILQIYFTRFSFVHVTTYALSSSSSIMWRERKEVKAFVAR
jgi:hypothetical protein